MRAAPGPRNKVPNKPSALISVTDTAICAGLAPISGCTAAMALLPQMALPAPSKRAWAAPPWPTFLRAIHSPMATAPKTDRSRAGRYSKGMPAKNPVFNSNPKRMVAQASMFFSFQRRTAAFSFFCQGPGHRFPQAIPKRRQSMPLPQPGKSGARATEPRVTAAKAAQGRGASGMGSSRIFT